MQIMIHACPDRIWFVEEILLPDLVRQGAENVTVWNDRERKGNLQACMEAFASLPEEGGTWHIQDDVLLSRDFVDRIRDLPEDRVICGFVDEYAGPNCNIRGEAYMADMWYSFPCTFIPNRYARECADWFFTGRWKTDAAPITGALFAGGTGDDFFFREYMEIHHGDKTVLNLVPCLVDHVDWLVGGSTVSRYRGYLARAVYWDGGPELLDELRLRIKALRR